jgi:tripartite-type tricarboxylate transporter receptor subunit TctC
MHRIVGGIIAALVPAVAFAQYPSRPLHLVVGFAPGGASDIISRAMSEPLARSFGQPVIVDNKPGAGSSLAAELVAKSTPDGYTVMIASPSAVFVNPIIMKNISYVTERDFVPVTLVTTSPLVAAVHPSVPVTSIKALVDYAKKNPGKLNYAEASASQRLSAEMFNKMAGVKIERVPYKASPQAMGDVMSGQVQLMFPDLPQGLAQIDAGKVRGLGTTGPQRTSVAPNLPAIAETVPGYSLVYWLAVFAPAGTPTDIQKTLADTIAEALKDPATAKAMTQGRMEISPLPLEQFAAYVKEQTTWWTTEIKAAGIEPE